jgi:hypothetical protein
MHKDSVPSARRPSASRKSNTTRLCYCSSKALDFLRQVRSSSLTTFKRAQTRPRQHVLSIGNLRLDVPIVTSETNLYIFSTTVIALSFLRHIGFRPCPNESEEERMARVKSTPDSEGGNYMTVGIPHPKKSFVTYIE